MGKSAICNSAGVETTCFFVFIMKTGKFWDFSVQNLEYFRLLNTNSKCKFKFLNQTRS